MEQQSTFMPCDAAEFHFTDWNYQKDTQNLYIGMEIQCSTYITPIILETI